MTHRLESLVLEILQNPYSGLPRGETSFPFEGGNNESIISFFSPTLTVEGNRRVVLRLKTLEKNGYGVESVQKRPSM